MTAGTTLAFAGAGALPLLVIARASELGSATAGAALLAAIAGAALVGTLIVAAAPEPPDDAQPAGAARRLVAAGRPESRVVRFLVCVGFALALAAATPDLALFGAALLVVGVADGLLLPAILAVRVEHTRPAERGAVFTTAASVKIAAGAAGAGAGGVLLTAAGASTALLAAAGLHLAGALLCVRYRSAS